MNRFAHILFLPPLLSAGLLAQADTTKFPWPDPAFTSSKPINGTFSEYRNTLSANHFHSGVDIGEGDGNPVYPSLSGVVHSLSSSDGNNNFVRVKTQIGSQWKHISYVHINPVVDLSVGDAVTAGSTVLGHIISGQGHVHFTERELVSSENASGVEINAIRSGGGLTPFDDPYTPVIDEANILFRQATTGSFVPAATLYGKIEIVVKISERNGPGSPGGTQTNNGTYAAGFRLRDVDTSAIIYEPPDAGLRFRFDRKPLDSYADSVFLPYPYSSTSAHFYRLTSGLGAQSVSTTRTAPTGYVDVSLLPEGPYILEIFTDDTRGNTDVAWIPVTVTHQDLIPPSRPTFRSVTVDNSGAMSVRWVQNSDPDLGGFRLYYRRGSVWTLAAPESLLTAGMTSYVFPSPPPFLQPSDSLNRFALALTAVDTAADPNESAQSDVYYTAFPWFTDASESSVNTRLDLPILIVDGFDRFGGSGSWSQPTHNFAEDLGSHLPNLVPVSTCSNEEIGSAAISLSDHHSIFWISGDESTTDETLTSTEQQYVKGYLETGGNFFISGSEIGWDLGRSAFSSAADIAFYEGYFKASYVYDGSTSMYAAQGVASTVFNGLSVTFGQTYPEDYPDDINPANGSQAVLTYNATRDGVNPRIAGIAYDGVFGSGTVPGKIVYIAFPIETIGSTIQRRTLVERVVGYFGIPTSVERVGAVVPSVFFLSQNYPNPFNPTTAFSLEVPERGNVSVSVYDILGRSVSTLMDGMYEGGTYSVSWNAAGHPSGTYFAVAQTAQSRRVRKILLIK